MDIAKKYIEELKKLIMKMAGKKFGIILKRLKKVQQKKI